MNLRLCLLVVFFLQGTLAYSSESEKIIAAKSHLENFIKLRSYDSALAYLDQNEELVLLDSELLKLSADIYLEVGNFSDAGSAYLQAASKALQNEVIDYNKLSLYYGEAAYSFSRLGLVEKSFEYNKVSKKYALKGQDSSRIANVYSNLGVDYERLGDYSQALIHFDSAYLLDKALKDTLGITYDLNNIGYLFVKWGKYDEAMKFYKESLDLAKVLGNNEMIARRYNNIGMALLLMGDLDSAEVNLKKSLRLHQKMNDSLNAARRLINLGEIENKRGNYNDAITFKKEGISYFISKNGGFALTEGKLSLAKSYGDANKYDLAIKEYEDVIKIAHEKSFLKVLSNALEGIHLVYHDLGDYENAYAYQEEFIKVKDSIYNENSEKILNEMQVKYDVEKKESEIDLLNTKNELANQKLLQKNREQLAGILAGIVALVFFITTYSQQRKKFKLKEALLLSEIDQLRLQISEAIKRSEESQEKEIDFDSVNSNLKSPLSQRELEIVKLVKSDLTNREIAEKVFVSINTVKFHLRNIYEKLDVGNREQAIAVLASDVKK